MVRAPYYDAANGVKRGAWSEEEDAMLKDYIQKYGHWNWRELPKYAGLSRCGKSCRLRWVNYLKPNLKKGGYTKEEEDTIIKLHDDCGKKWSAIAAQLPGRTDNEIKNYWHSHLKNRSKKNQKKQQSNATSGNQIREPGSMIASIPSNHILESSPLCPETSYNPTAESSPQLSSSTSFSSSSNHVHVPETILGSSLYSGDFWTEPFVPDNSYFPNNEYASSFPDEGEYLSPYVPYIGDTAELLFQAMQELPEDLSNLYCFRC